MQRHLALAVVVLVLASPPAARSSDEKLTVRLLNKDGVVKYDKAGKLTLKVELALTLGRERQLKPNDLRLAFLDADLRQLEGVTIAVPKEWEAKRFKKGENKDT